MINKNWKPLFYSLLLAVSMLGTSCLNVTEEFFFKKDGSGTAKVVYDLTEMVALLDMMSSMGGEAEDIPSMDELWESTQIVDALANLAGITNVKNLTNKDSKVFGFSYDFASIEALNRSVGVTAGPDLGGDQSMGLSKEGALFTMSKKGLSRSFPKMDTPEDVSEEDMSMMSSMMGEASYNVIYTFEKKIKKVKAKDAEIVNQDGNSVSMKADFLKMMKDEQNLNVDIKLK